MVDLVGRQRSKPLNMRPRKELAAVFCESRRAIKRPQARLSAGAVCLPEAAIWGGEDLRLQLLYRKTR